MAFTRITDATNNIANLANQPVEAPATLKQKFDQIGEDLKDWGNNVLLTELESTTNGDSGADNIGATALTGGVATTVQGIVEELDTKAVNGVGALNTHKTSADHDGRYFTESEVVALLLANQQGNHLGLWQGYTPTQTEPGIQSVVDGHTTQLAGIEKNLTYKEKQTNLYAKFYQKLRKGTATTLVCLGDSMTYGQDTVSGDRRPPDGSVCDDGTTKTEDRGSVTYPETLQTIMNEVYGVGKVTVINKGRSGDDVSEAITHWNVTGDMALISLGINDAINSPYAGNLDTFLSNYRQLIEKWLDGNCGIIIMTPTKGQVDYDADVSIFRQSIFFLAQEYNIPVVKGNELLQNVNDDNYSDSVHLNGKGYAYLGSRIASIFIGNGIADKKEVVGGITLSTLEQDNYTLIGGTKYTTNSDTGSAEGLNNTGVGILMNNVSNALYYSFYTSEENLIIYPIIYYGANASAKVEIDFSKQTPQPTNDFSVLNVSIVDRTNPPSFTTITNGSQALTITKKDTIMGSPLIITSKGWHTLKITSPAPNIVLQGINFMSMDDFKTFVTMTNNFLSYYQNIVLSNYTNKMTNGNMVGTTGYTPAGCSLSALSNTLSLTGLGSGAAMGSDGSTTLSPVQGNKLYIRTKQLVTDSVCTKLQFSAYGETSGTIGAGIVIQNTPTINNEYTLSAIVTIPSGIVGNVKISPQCFYVDSATQNGKGMQVREILLVDLTALVGAGNEPDKTWCDANLAFVA